MSLGETVSLEETMPLEENSVTVTDQTREIAHLKRTIEQNARINEELDQDVTALIAQKKILEQKTKDQQIEINVLKKQLELYESPGSSAPEGGSASLPQNPGIVSELGLVRKERDELATDLEEAYAQNEILTDENSDLLKEKEFLESTREKELEEMRILTEDECLGDFASDLNKMAEEHDKECGRYTDAIDVLRAENEALKAQVEKLRTSPEAIESGKDVKLSDDMAVYNAKATAENEVLERRLAESEEKCSDLKSTLSKTQELLKESRAAATSMYKNLMKLQSSQSSDVDNLKAQLKKLNAQNNKSLISLRTKLAELADQQNITRGQRYDPLANITGKTREIQRQKAIERLKRLIPEATGADKQRYQQELADLISRI